jgi:uroporphyrinogen-III decarboxylase
MDPRALQDWDRWSRPYIERIVRSVRATHPNTPLTLYANGSGGLLERMGSTGVDVVGLDWTIDMADARRRLGNNVAVQVGAHGYWVGLMVGWRNHGINHGMSCGPCEMI